MSDNALQLFEQELNRHINPEAQRNFQKKQFVKSLEYLMSLSEEEMFRPKGFRIAVVGSNGKGSTAYYLASLLKNILPIQNNLDLPRPPVGLYTSPHLISPLERIRMDLKEPSPETALAAVHAIRVANGEKIDQLSYFELMTVLALYLFRKNNCQYQVYEAGLGGRLDATRIAKPDVVILTAISLEHVAILGNSIDEILSEKAAIACDNTKLMIAMKGEGVDRSILENKIQEMGYDFPVELFEDINTPPENSYLKFNFKFANFCIETTQRHKLIPEYSPEEIAARKKTPLSPPPVPGRLEERKIAGSGENPNYIRFFYDNAHNEAAMRVALKNLKQLPDFQGTNRCAILIGTLPDRDPELMLKICRNEGFENISLLKSEILHPAANNSPSAIDLDKSSITDYFSRMIDEKNISTFLMTGTHRIYSYFHSSIQLTRERTGLLPD